MNFNSSEVQSLTLAIEESCALYADGSKVSFEAYMQQLYDRAGIQEARRVSHDRIRSSGRRNRILRLIHQAFELRSQSLPFTDYGQTTALKAAVPVTTLASETKPARKVVKLPRELAVALTNEYLRLCLLPDNMIADRVMLAYHAQSVLPTDKQRPEAARHAVFKVIERAIASGLVKPASVIQQMLAHQAIDNQTAAVPTEELGEDRQTLTYAETLDLLREEIAEVDQMVTTVMDRVADGFSNLGPIIRGALAEYSAANNATSAAALKDDSSSKAVPMMGGVIALLNGSRSARYPNNPLFDALENLQRQQQAILSKLDDRQETPPDASPRQRDEQNAVLFVCLNTRLMELVIEHFADDPNVAVCQTLAGARQILNDELCHELFREEGTCHVRVLSYEERLTPRQQRIVNELDEAYSVNGTADWDAGFTLEHIILDKPANTNERAALMNSLRSMADNLLAESPDEDEDEDEEEVWED